MTTRAQIEPVARASYVPALQSAPLVAAPMRRSAAAVIADLLRPRIAPMRSREEQAFIDLQHGSPA